MKELTDFEKDILNEIINKEFHSSVNKMRCIALISIAEKHGIDTTEMKSDFEFYFKQPYK